MLDISSDLIIEKNKLTSTGVWIILLEITYENESPIYLCLNNENVTWGGNTWIPAIMKLEGISETTESEIPTIKLSFYDINRQVIPTIIANSGGVGAEVIIRVVHSDYLASSTPDYVETTELLETNINSQMLVTLKVGSENLINKRCPLQRYLKNNCRFIFKRASIDFTSGGTTEISQGDYILGDTSGDTAVVVSVKLTSGAWPTGTAAGVLVIDTILGGFFSENISTYSDSAFTSLIQSNAATVSGPSTGRCGYIGSVPSCDRSLAGDNGCRAKNNEIRFGGFPGLANTGFFK